MMKEAYPTLLSLERTHKAMYSKFEEALSPFGLNGAQWDTLRLVGNEPGITGAEIARRTQTTPPATTKMLQKLEGAGLVTRHLPARGRAVETHLTPLGVNLLKQGDRVAHDLEQRLRAVFTEEQHLTFLKLLSRCYQMLKK
jgi:DNA-binding MarR family transcriptional regulator